MVLALVAASLVLAEFLSVHAALDNRCTQSDVCDCPTINPILTIVDTLPPGGVVDNLTTRGTLDSGCMIVSLNNSQIILDADLFAPCITGNPSCNLNCGPYQLSIIIKIVYVTDRFTPEFPKQQYNTTVLENVTALTDVFIFSEDSDGGAVDKDCATDSNPIYYSLLDNSTGHFSITPITGKIRTTDKGLDYERLQSHRLVVKAWSQNNPNNTGTTTVCILVGDVDDNPPVFNQSEYRLDIDEEQEPIWLESIPPVNCYDFDRGINTTVLFSFPDINQSDTFLEINSSSGKFRPKVVFDRENMTALPSSFQIWCYQENNPEKRSTASVRLNVLDVNDNAAVFAPATYTISVPENRAGYILTVTATDKDMGDNGAVLYEIFNDTGVFEVGADTGMISGKNVSVLDRETRSQLYIHVVAHDLEGNYSSNTATVTVTLEDVNDNAPTFEHERLVIKTNATQVGELIGVISAEDNDDPATGNGNVTYEINTSWSPNTPFSVDKYSGNVTIEKPLVADGEHTFFVSACDNPPLLADRRCNVASVVVLVGWRGSEVNESHVTWSISENVPISTPIAVLPVKGESYEVSVTEFSVDIGSDTLVTNAVIDREMNDTFNFMITVFQYNEVIGNLSVTLTVLDVNDNSPVFLHEDYVIYANLNLKPGDSLAVINATDEDMDDNGRVSYSLQNVKIDAFSIDPNNGELKAGSQWSEPGTRALSVYQFICVATDTGSPRLGTSITVVISFLKLSNGSLGLPTPLPTEVIETNQNAILDGIGALVSAQVTMTELVPRNDEESSVKSVLYIKVSSTKRSVQTSDELARSLIEQWSEVQDLFRLYMSSVGIQHTDSALSTTEIALIAIAGALLFGTAILILIICRQWDRHIKEHRLYDTLRRPSTLYASQEMRMNFDHEVPSGFNTFRGASNKDADTNLEGSFGGFTNANYVGDESGAKTPTWSTNTMPMVQRWRTSDSLKDAMESLDDLTSRLNAEDSISRVTNMSREQRSLKSTRSGATTPRGENSTPNSQTTTPRKEYARFDSSRSEPNTDGVKSVYRKDYENLKINPLAAGNTDHNNGNATTSNTSINDGVTLFMDGQNPPQVMKQSSPRGRQGQYENVYPDPPVDYPADIELEANRTRYANLKFENNYSDDTSKLTDHEFNEIIEESTAL